MLLSIVVPSNRTGLSAYSRILDLCSCVSEDVQLVVRDNSTDKKKRKFMDGIKENHCKLIKADHCLMWENLREAIRAAEGEYVLCVADDDFFDRMALENIISGVRSIQDDSRYIGLIGDYLVGGEEFTVPLKFPPLDGDRPLQRYANFLATGPCSVLVWGVHRRSIFLEALDQIKTLPMEFSFHDLVLTALLLLRGRYSNINRFFYYYCGMSNWNTSDAVLKNDFAYYRREGLDISTYRLHWLICAFEGAMLILKSQVAQDVTSEQRTEFAQLWFTEMRKRMAGHLWQFELPSEIDHMAGKIQDKWLNERETLIFSEALVDIAQVMAMSNPAMGQKYIDFWGSL